MVGTNNPAPLYKPHPFVCLASDDATLAESTVVAETPFGEDERDDEEGDQTDRLARDLIENTAPEPSPPPPSEEEGPQQPQPQQGKSLLLMSDSRVDGEMALGDMITPRPTDETEQDVVEDAPEAALG